MATFSVTEKRPTKPEAKVVFELDLGEVQFILDAVVGQNDWLTRKELVRQLWNAVSQARDIENG